MKIQRKYPIGGYASSSVNEERIGWWVVFHTPSSPILIVKSKNIVKNDLINNMERDVPPMLGDVTPDKYLSYTDVIFIRTDIA